MNFFNKLRSSLSKTSKKFAIGLEKVFARGKFDQEALDSIEELLITSDLGVYTTNFIMDRIRSAKPKTEDLYNEIMDLLRHEIEEILDRAQKTIKDLSESKPEVFMICGVNGNGKTTTIAKLAHKFQEQRKTVMVAACDTFRAAAIEQLQEWSERLGCTFVRGSDNTEPASVAYKALQQAKEQQKDVLLIDTAGRLHTQTNLMQELEKCVRILKKLDKDSPHHILLVLDATTGQNAMNQVELFQKSVPISGLILTKLDGSAKGGIVVALSHKFQIPIYAVGVGEGIDDLQDFSAKEFANALISR